MGMSLEEFGRRSARRIWPELRRTIEVFFALINWRRLFAYSQKARMCLRHSAISKLGTGWWRCRTRTFRSQFWQGQFGNVAVILAFDKWFGSGTTTMAISHATFHRAEFFRFVLRQQGSRRSRPTQQKDQQRASGSPIDRFPLPLEAGNHSLEVWEFHLSGRSIHIALSISKFSSLCLPPWPGE